MKLLIIGGYGVFGSRLAQMALQDGHTVLIAGRSHALAKEFCDLYGGTPLCLDRADQNALRKILNAESPDVVIDAAGPFQTYVDTPYAIAEISLNAGADYLDLSDDALFTSGITALDSIAIQQSRVALSGVSSVPAISAAAVRDLNVGLRDTALIASAIFPGNRAPRGLSVIKAILQQVGSPIKIWRGGQWREVPGWSGQRLIQVNGGDLRKASMIGAPDLLLFPKHFAARSVVFRAGLELSVMHQGLRVLGKLRQKRVFPNLVGYAGAVKSIAEKLERFGSDQGYMVVSVGGRTDAGIPETRQWSLVVEAGDGPFIPAIPAIAVLQKLEKAKIPPGSRPAMTCLSLSEIEQTLSRLKVTTKKSTQITPPMFEAALPGTWDKLPAELRKLHDLWDLNIATGQASVTRGQTLLARIIAFIFRFPPTATKIPVTVTMEKTDKGERWTRDFNGNKFTSNLSFVSPGILHERFGAMTFELSVPADKDGLQLPVTKGWFLGVPIPKFCLPRSEASEYAENGCFHFDVRLSAPLAGLLVHYEGWLTLDDATPSD